MDARHLKFLVEILGTDGAKALSKAAARCPDIESILIPRSLMAWLELVKSADFEGSVPGVGNTYLSFTKSEEKYSGSIIVNGNSYDFSEASLLHIASSIAVSLGVDHISPIQDLDLVRLGKSIDLLVKAHSATLQVQANETFMKAIASIPAGTPIRDPRAATSKVYDYSHVLTPQHRKSGFTMRVLHQPESGTVTAKVYRGPLEVGSVKGTHNKGALNIETADVNEQQRGQGLGTALYEGLMTHAHHSGIKEVAGSVHSTMASGLHQKLSQKHGMEYKATPTPFPRLAAPEPGPDDNRVGPYKYALKTEPSPTEKAEGPGPAHMATAQKGPDAGVMPSMQSQKGPPKPKKPVQPLNAAKPVTGIPKPGKTLKLSEEQTRAKCEVCGGRQFEDKEFKGCLCFRSLAKHIHTERNSIGYVLRCDRDIDLEAFRSLLKTFLGD